MARLSVITNKASAASVVCNKVVALLPPGWAYFDYTLQYYSVLLSDSSVAVCAITCKRARVYAARHTALLAVLR